MLFQKIFNRCGLYLINIGYYPFLKSNFKNKLLIGNFECSKYFNNYRNLLCKEFEPKSESLLKNKEFFCAIKRENSVCVTIRRGDFIEDVSIMKRHFVCNSNYFYKALEVIKKDVKNPVFFIFSDDIQWVRDNMNFPKESFFESGDDPIWEKLRLMSACKHFILSNSTFSWWCQYLSDNYEKVVVAPSRWKNFDYRKDGKWEICEDSWKYVEV